ncbi:GerA spore germination protein [Paenibacillus cellulosilyticus]|uniref:GerA spore germination protein n=1 Tax=Paenibacillus cellulosilyticus TaxID=375489 RepID=A0A2V2YMA6_9BACL|nr:spore germination protein [Paenibacillus cellulosilyticus]PWV95545.1 GerA spore germination protein [Paenibacillus cellulosilyticus]
MEPLITKDSRHDDSKRWGHLNLDLWMGMVKPCGDVSILTIPIGGNGGSIAHLFYCMGMINSQALHRSILQELDHWNSQDGKSDIPLLMPIDDDATETHAFKMLASGILIACIDGYWYQANIASPPGRQPEESTMEVSLRGPRDGFVEKLETNIALVRGRLRTPDLHCEFYSIGSVTKTEIVMLYLSGKAPVSLVDEMRRRIQAVEIEALYGASQLEELVSDRPRSLFPLVDYIGRPDYVVQALMSDRIAVIADGSPSAIIAPGTLTLQTKSPEDIHLPYYYVTLERLLRFVGIMLALYFPGFWVALSAFNTDQLPFNLLATITLSRTGLPLSAPLEMALMLAMFELFREAGVRLPRPVGQTVSVVGGLIVGDAAIRAGLTSPTMLVAAAVTAVATFTLVNQSLNGSVSVIRLFILLLSSVLGIFGFFISLFAVLVYICSLESFGHPYLLPLAPIKWKKVLGALGQLPWSVQDKPRKDRY